MSDKNKSVKVPKFFKPAYPAALFEKKILNRLFIKADREFIDTLYELKGGERVRPETVPQAEAQRLKKLAKAIKTNASPLVSLPKVALVLVIVGGILLFNLLFKNILVEHALEAALSAAFNAKAELGGVDFDIFGARLAIDHCEVANAQEPMRNLFELNRVNVDIDFNQLLRGKLILDDVQCGQIRWDTPRQFSGALVARDAQKPVTQEQKNSAPDAGKMLTDLAKGINAEELFNREKSKLKSLEALNTANTALNEINTRVQTDVTDFSKKVTELDKPLREIQAINLKTMRDPVSIKNSLETVRKTSQSVSDVISQGSKLNSALTADVTKMKGLGTDVTNALAADKAYLASLVDIKSGKALNIAADAIQNLLQSKLGALYGYAAMALQAVQHFKTSGPQQPAALAKLPEIKRSQGVFVSFPVKQYPEFLLKHLGTSVKNPDETVVFALDMRDISNNPELWTRPTSFFTFMTFEGKTVRVTGVVDLKQNAKERLVGKTELANFDFESGPALSFLDLDNVKGTVDAVANFSIDPQQKFNGWCDLVFHGLDVSLAKADSLVGKMLRDTLTGKQNITARIIFSAAPDGQLLLTTTTNLDQLLAKQLDTAFASLAANAQRQLEQAFAAQTNSDLAKNNNLQTTIQANVKEADKYRQQLDTYQKQLTQKEKELEKKLTELSKQIIPSLDKGIPKLPGF